MRINKRSRTRPAAPGGQEACSRQAGEDAESLAEALRTARRRIEALERSQARLAGTIASAMDAIISIDSRQRVVVFNTAAERMFRYSASQVVGEPLDRFIPARYRPRHQDYVRGFGETGVTSRSMRSLGTLTAVRSDGEEFPIEATISQVEAGGERLFTVIIRDITERVALEEELRQRVEDLAVADQRKDQFLAMLAHELRNPLGAISNAVHVLQQASAPEAARQRALQVLQRQVRHQGRLVDDLLDVSRLIRGLVEIRREPLDLTLVVRDTAEDYRTILEREGVGLSMELPQEPVCVEGDSTRLAQVLGNLLNNAAKFTSSGGSVTVRLGEENTKRLVRVTVEDTGEGLSDQLLPHVFDTFVQGERTLARSRGGLGLGLAIARGLIALHGGQIWVESEGPGCGSRFTFSLPLSTTAALPNRESPPRPEPESLRILVVEDNRDAAETLRDLLELHGYEVEIALSGPAGLETAARYRPDVVLCDIGLPGMDGYEVARRLRADTRSQASDFRDSGSEADFKPPALKSEISNPKSPTLVAVTGYGQDEDRRRSREAGFDHHLVKPVDPEELQSVLVRVRQQDGPD